MMLAVSSCFVFLLLCHVSLHTHASVNFIVHGDWGWNSFNQSLIAYEMGKYAWLINAKFVIALGDNFYVDGVDNTTDKLWDSAYHDVYTAASLQIPWYAILGNHDYHGSIDAQVARTFEENSWKMPATYYAINYTLDSDAIMTIFYLDTQLLDPGHDDTTNIYEDEDWEVKQAKHLQWLDDQLTLHAPISTWLIVAGHYPIYSIGVNGDNTNLLGNLYPILQKYKIHAYLTGHDHNTQFALMPDDIVHVVSGQSAGRGPFGAESVNHLGISVSTPYQLFYSGACGFAYIEAASDYLNVSFVDDTGQVRYTGSVPTPHDAAFRETYYSGLSQGGETAETDEATGFVTVLGDYSLYLLAIVAVLILIGIVNMSKKLASALSETDTNGLRNDRHDILRGPKSDRFGTALDISIRSDVSAEENYTRKEATDMLSNDDVISGSIMKSNIYSQPKVKHSKFVEMVDV